MGKIIFLLKVTELTYAGASYIRFKLNSLGNIPYLVRKEFYLKKIN